MIDLRDNWCRFETDHPVDIDRAIARSDVHSGQLVYPIALVPVAGVYHVEGVDHLQLSPATLAKIFTGAIKTWNDPAVVKDNPGVTLPAVEITASRAGESRPVSRTIASYLARRANSFHCVHLEIAQFPPSV